MAVVDSARHLIKTILYNVCQYDEPLILLGLFYAGKLTLKAALTVFDGFKTYMWPTFLMDLDLIEKFGTWAVVTGGSDGIGKAYACELARRRLNIILISRNHEKLIASAVEIESCYGVQVCAVQADFANGREEYCKVAKVLFNKEIGILVNNVGVMYDCPTLFQNVSQECIWDHINVNIAATTVMTHLILPQMLQRGRGAIINIASISATKPIPLLAVYSATKAYVEFFSRSLNYEYASKGILVQTISPFYVSTGLTKFSEDLQSPGLFVPRAKTFAGSAIRTIGHSDYNAGYWTHGLLSVIGHALPEWIWVKITIILHEFLTRNYPQCGRPKCTQKCTPKCTPKCPQQCTPKCPQQCPQQCTQQQCTPQCTQQGCTSQCSQKQRVQQCCT